MGEGRRGGATVTPMQMRMHRVPTIVFVISLVLAPRQLTSQIRTGAHVRVTVTTRPDTTEGRIARQTPDSLFLVSLRGNSMVGFANSGITQLQILRRNRSKFGIGFFAGLAVGVAILQKENAFVCTNGCWILAIPMVAGTSLAGGVVGILLGGHRWEDVRISSSP